MEAATAAPAPGWPSPPEWPLYVSVERAAEIAGVSYELMRAWTDDHADPMPHIVVGATGKKKLVRVAALPGYMERKER